MANMNQVREWWDGISPREQSLVVALGGTLIVMLLVWVGLRVHDGLQAIENRNDHTRFALKELYDYRLNQHQTSERPQVTIPDEPLKLETYLSNIASEVGVEIPQFDRRPQVTKAGFVENSTRVELRKVSLSELTSFLERVETQNKVVVVKYIRVRSARRDEGKLNVQLDISTYAKVTVEDEDKDKDKEG